MYDTRKTPTSSNILPKIYYSYREGETFKEWFIENPDIYQVINPYEDDLKIFFNKNGYDECYSNVIKEYGIPPTLDPSIVVNNPGNYDYIGYDREVVKCSEEFAEEVDAETPIKRSIDGCYDMQLHASIH